MKIVTENNQSANLIFKVVSTIQYVLIAILLSIIVEMLFTSRYSIYLVEVALWISQILAIMIMGLLGQRFISWYRSNANMVVLTYALATAMICLNIIFALLYVTNGLADKPAYIRPFRDPTMAYSTLMTYSIQDML